MYIYGKNVVKEILSSDKKIIEAYVGIKFDDNEILTGLKNKIKIKYMEKRDLDKIVDGLHQGIILKVEDYEYTDIDDLIKEDGFLVILDHLEDPHNFGAIIRTCEAAGIDGIIIPKDRSVEVNGTVMKVSTGTLENVPISRVTNLNQTIDYLKKNGYWIIGTDMEGTNYSEIDYKGKIAVIIGNEGSGMSRLTRENCDFIATIPMKGAVNSLNASVATAIVIFKALEMR